MCFRNLTCLSQIKVFSNCHQNPNTKEVKSLEKSLKKDPEKLEVYLKKDREQKKKQYHEKMAKLSVEERQKLKEKDRLRKKKEKKRKK